MICLKCEADIPDSSKYCSKCGANIKNIHNKDKVENNLDICTESNINDQMETKSDQNNLLEVKNSLDPKISANHSSITAIIVTALCLYIILSFIIKSSELHVFFYVMY